LLKNSFVTDGACDTAEPVHTYNQRVEKAITSFAEYKPSFVMFGKGRNPDESSYVMVENGNYLGFGFIQDEKTRTIFEPELLKGFLERHPHDHHAESIIGYFLQNPSEGDRIIEYKPVSVVEDELMAIGLFA
jgi:DNA polymerase III subunit epsilon